MDPCFRSAGLAGNAFGCTREQMTEPSLASLLLSWLQLGN